ncbi:MAG: glycosyltransferase family 4 protein [Chitinophagaceae bacterium]|nr:glycosyltransferase family 4 protein [Chitinophagaceae bacterium]
MGVKTTLIIAGKRSITGTARKVNRYLKENDCNILHAHLLISDLIATVLKYVFNPGVYLLSTKHGYREKFLQQYEPGKRYRPFDYYYFITRFILSRIDRNVAVSKGIADLYVSLGLAKTAYPVIHHGIKIEEFNKEEYKAKCRLAQPQLIIVGRIELFKGHHFLIEALPVVAAAFPGVKLLVLGEGSEKNNCIKKVNDLGLQDQVEFLGFQDHPYAYISHSDVIILPSLFEPFGLVYIEAFALKTPVVAFNTPAGNEIMENNETALMVDKGDSRALADKIIYLLKNKTASDSMAENAFKKYNAFFTREIMIKNTADWYHTLGL